MKFCKCGKKIRATQHDMCSNCRKSMKSDRKYCACGAWLKSKQSINNGVCYRCDPKRNKSSVDIHGYDLKIMNVQCINHGDGRAHTKILVDVDPEAKRPPRKLCKYCKRGGDDASYYSDTEMSGMSLLSGS